jgi:hypothetical protein
MSISERINPDNLNIHQFQETPETRPELVFDIEEYLTEEDRIFLMSEMVRCLPSNIREYTYYASLIKKLWPNESLSLIPEDTVVTDLKKLQERDLEDMMSGVELEFLKDAVATYPNIQKMINPDRLDELLEKDRHEAANGDDDALYYHLAKYMANAKSIEPNRIIKLTLAEKNRFDQTLKSYFKDPDVFFELAANIKIIDPSFNLNLTPEYWKVMQEKLAVYAGSLKYEMAYHMKILAAHSVRVTAPGVIEFQMYPPDINSSTPQIPETRKF